MPYKMQLFQDKNDCYKDQPATQTLRHKSQGNAEDAVKK